MGEMFCNSVNQRILRCQHLSTKSRSRTPSETAIRCSFMMLMFRIPRSTPEMNVQCNPALSASCSCVNPSVSRRTRIVCPRGFLGSVIGTSTHRCFRFRLGEHTVYSLCQGKSIVLNDFVPTVAIFGLHYVPLFRSLSFPFGAREISTGCAVTCLEKLHQKPEHAAGVRTPVPSKASGVATILRKRRSRRRHFSVFGSANYFLLMLRSAILSISFSRASEADPHGLL